jgi:hypothetical protein
MHTEGLVPGVGAVGTSLHRDGELGVMDRSVGRIRQQQHLQGGVGGQAI